MNKKTRIKAPSSAVVETPTLATVLAVLQRPGAPAGKRLRDLQSAVRCVAKLLGNEPQIIALDMETISVGLGAISPFAAGMTAKRFANIKSDFVAAVKASGVKPVFAPVKKALSPRWVGLFKRLSGRRAHIGLSRFARYANGKGIAPDDVNDAVFAGFISEVRQGSLHRNPNALHRQVTLIWNKAASDPSLDLGVVTVPSFRGPPKRFDRALLRPEFKEDADRYLSWCGGADPFAADARDKALAPRTLRLSRDQIHAAVSDLVHSGIDPNTVRSLADLVVIDNFKRIVRWRVEHSGGIKNSFNFYLTRMLVRVAREWVKVDAATLAELTRLASKLPAPKRELTPKNKAALRQFDDPQAWRRLVRLPEQLWKEVKDDQKPSFRTLAKAQAALGIGIVTYMPIRSENLWELAFDTHLFIRPGAGATSTLELPSSEVKNENEVAFDVPPHLVKMLIEYCERVAPKIVGQRPIRLFVRVDGRPKSQAMVAHLVKSYAWRRAGIVLTPHQYRHLNAKLILDENPGAHLTVKDLLGHKSLKSTMIYTGIDRRRAGLYQQKLIEDAIATAKPTRLRGGRRGAGEAEKRNLSHGARIPTAATLRKLASGRSEDLAGSLQSRRPIRRRQSRISPVRGDT
jgi:integrase